MEQEPVCVVTQGAGSLSAPHQTRVFTGRAGVQALALPTGTNTTSMKSHILSLYLQPLVCVCVCQSTEGGSWDFSRAEYESLSKRSWTDVLLQVYKVRLAHKHVCLRLIKHPY